MRRDLLPALMWFAALGAALGGCRGGAWIGETCGSNDDCDGSLQCLNDICEPRCERAPDCGDGYACRDHLCVAADLQQGDICHGESDCAAGLACQIKGSEVDPMTNRLVSNCVKENLNGHPAGSSCAGDNECRNGTCELGHCVDLCRDSLDCADSTGCMTIPRVAVAGALFEGCLPTQGTVSWDIPVISPSAQILLPVPSGAPSGDVSAELVMSVDDPGQKVGVQSVLDPCGCTRYTVPCSFLPPSDRGACTDLIAADQFYSQDPSSGIVPFSRTIASNAAGGICGAPVICNPNGDPMVNHFRHIPAFGRSVLLMPSIPRPGEIKNGAYQIQVSSFGLDNSPGSAIPHVTAVIRIGTGNALDLHFFFLDLDDHPCSAMTGNAALSAGAAQGAALFQTDYLGELKRVFGRIGIGVNAASYQDIPDRHALDGIDVADLGSLFALGTDATGIDVFFVRSLSPLGVEVFGPSPGPAGVARTSGIAISLDTLCYRDWRAVARLTAHAIGHYMGLYHNIEPPDPVQGPSDPPWQDLDPDTDDSINNLMYFSQIHDGADLTVDQTFTLSRSAVLR
jgi:hypothetical protein